MNIESLKMFCTVVDEGSISKAARLRFVSQPAVTRQIHQLEEVYGMLLFERVDGKLLLSEAGKTLYPYAKEIIEYMKRSVEAIDVLRGSQDTVLRVGASLTIGEYLLPGLLGSFSKSDPDIKFSLTIGNTPTILSKLDNNDIDIALVEGAVKKENFIVEKFAEDELILVAPFHHKWKDREKIHITELPEEKMIWRESNSGTRLIVEEAFKEKGILDQIESAMELGSMQSIKSAVEADLGVSLLPKLTVVKELTYGTLCEIKIADFHLTRDLWMVQKVHRFQKTGLRHFIDFIRGK
ncbi:LysR family transcriptional regulator [Neobacillus sp. MM2021_6]|uniref:LysR family transcriptional regulator n=1 Tax=Bacillaceae TaxID=186817 RepID=UPI0014078097|nr:MULTISPECIES: LysR family transcriptional regulator [Bacillaceae]MBO0959851.1 LysR family transcriptional regulator [Neobacillus sp. MM2021_6]NHC20501.1 LysR family transcriptional regulator [Bacillus sp. MM2020_4]